MAAASTQQQWWVVSGGNRGIGLAIVRGLLAKGQSVFMGSRDVAKGEEAAKTLAAAEGRLKVVQLDVTDEASVSAAVATVKATTATVAGLINNAGGAASMGWSGLEDHLSTINLNVHGVIRLTAAFLPLVDQAAGRVVMVSSGAASMFIQKLSEERQQFFLNASVTMAEIMAFLDEMRATGEGGGGSAAFEEKGLTDGSYGCSKAILNSYTMLLAAENPSLKINTCSPGFVYTDLTHPFAVSAGKTPEEMGMVTPDQGATCPLYLALDASVPTPAGQAWYYGSDSKRSPLHKYRSPGDAPYDGAI